MFLFTVIYYLNLLLFVITVAPPEIEFQPISIVVGAGGNATFTVVASGEGLTFQWFGPGGVALIDIPEKTDGATMTTLQIFNVQSRDDGSYRVQVSNAGGLVSSDSVNLTISKSPYFQVHY